MQVSLDVEAAVAVYLQEQCLRLEQSLLIYETVKNDFGETL